MIVKTMKLYQIQVQKHQFGNFLGFLEMEREHQGLKERWCVISAKKKCLVERVVCTYLLFYLAAEVCVDAQVWSTASSESRGPYHFAKI